ncbi:RagB/SusD family nutrient uptake outer membrane protein [Gemmatimonas sp.]|uniref:RagB/SusD family nutrient uptake outer membrane protein n=1 Tax=Gemmatimonas sp. TaxID=1962908 RepID=UPI00356A98C7
MMSGTPHDRPKRQPRRRTLVVTALASLALSACQMFSTEVKNPNAVTEDAIAEAASAASSLVIGLYGAVNAAGNQLAGVTGAASDELMWVGSREYWNLLDIGDIGDPQNEYTDGLYPFVSQARWLANYTVPKLEGYDKSGALRSRADLPQAYFLSGTIYTLIGEHYEDFIIASDRTKNAAPIGELNMRSMFDSAVVNLDKGLAAATALNNQPLRGRILGMRARAKYSKAVWGTLRAPRGFPANPLINDAGANADASAALTAMGSDAFRYRFDVVTTNNGGYFSTGFEMNQRLELRAGNRYIVANSAGTSPLVGIAGIRLVDPVTNQADPATLKNIDECCRLASTQNVGWTATSAKEMRLILAEAALATNNTADFTTQINAVRTVDGLPAWTGTPAARDLLVHERSVSLFLQGRRLTDHYRFQIRADRWIAARGARPCFFPISSNERQQNLLAPQPAQDRPAACQ